jgi:hypothetical protein
MQAQKVFGFADQKRFAEVSGDFNPMHLDPVQARRTQAGAPVVHGIHLLLWSLDSLAASQPDLPPMLSLRAQFHKFVYLDEAVKIEVAQQTVKGIRLVVSAGGAPRTKIAVQFGHAADGCPEAIVYGEVTPFLQQPAVLDLNQIPGRLGRLQFRMTEEVAAAMFPAATRWLGACRVAALAATTHLVGMVCPGLYSIYDGLSIRLCRESTAAHLLAFRVTDVDERFRSVDIQIAGGGLEGALTCFARIPPVPQPRMESLTQRLSPGEFAGSLALVVGGSRGLGELTAKLIAAGGGRVIVTWHRGKDDAHRVAEEIRAAGGACDTLEYDALKSAGEQLERLPDAPTHAYYFSTPPLSRPQKEIFSSARLEEFLHFYVNSFWQLGLKLRELQPRISLFYPSTISVEKRPEGMTEYTMAKAAGEILCADMSDTMAPLHVTSRRLPRLLTDLTAGIVPAETADPIATMLPIIREVQSWPHSSEPVGPVLA